MINNKNSHLNEAQKILLNILSFNGTTYCNLLRTFLQHKGIYHHESIILFNQLNNILFFKDIDSSDDFEKRLKTDLERLETDLKGLEADDKKKTKNPGIISKKTDLILRIEIIQKVLVEINAGIPFNTKINEAIKKEYSQNEEIDKVLRRIEIVKILLPKNNIVDKEYFENHKFKEENRLFLQKVKCNDFENYEQYLRILIFRYSNTSIFLILSALSDADLKIETAKREILFELFNKLAISVLKAEYLIFDAHEYSDELKKLSGYEGLNNFTIKDVIDGNKTYSDGKELKREDLNYRREDYTDHDFVKSIISSIWYLIEACRIVSNCINIEEIKNNRQLIIVNNNRASRVDTFYVHQNKGCTLASKGTIKSFELALESIIDITLIDHINIYTKANINKLILATERIEVLYRLLTGLGLSKSNALYIEFSKIYQIVKKKAYTILHQMIVHRDELSSLDTNNIFNKDFFEKYKILGCGFEEGSMENIIKKEGRNTDSNYSSFVRVKKRISLTNEIQTKDDFLRAAHVENAFCFLNNTSNFYFDVNSFNEVSEYFLNRYCSFTNTIYSYDKDGYNYYLSKNEKSISQITTEIKNILADSNQKRALSDSSKAQYFIIKFLHSVLATNIQSGIILSSEDIKFLKECTVSYKATLFILNNFISQNFDYYVRRFQTPFQYCYYIVNEKNEIQFKEIDEDFIINYSINRSDHVFFFMSAGINPLNIDFLKDFYKLHNNEVLSIEDELSILRLNNITVNIQEGNKIALENQNTEIDEKLKQKSIELVDVLNKTKGDIEQELEQELERHDETISSMQKEIKDTSRSNITTLGVLGAFIAFTTLSLGTVKSIDNISKYIMFVLAYTAALLVFIFAIRYNKKEGEGPGKYIKNRWPYFAVFLALLSLGVFMYYFNKDELTKETIDKTSIDVNTKMESSANISVKGSKDLHVKDTTQKQ